MGDPYSVGKTMKRSQAQPGILKLPNRETREAMKAAERGEIEAAKDAADLLKKLKSLSCGRVHPGLYQTVQARLPETITLRSRSRED